MKKPQKIFKNPNPAITNPSKYLCYGSRSHKILCYAKFKKTESFTSSDYRNFLVTKVDTAQIDDSLRHLSKMGYLSKKPHPNPPIYKIHHIYALTLSGEHALVHIARKHFERQQRRNRLNAYSRWDALND